MIRPFSTRQSGSRADRRGAAGHVRERASTAAAEWAVHHHEEREDQAVPVVEELVVAHELVRDLAELLHPEVAPPYDEPPQGPQVFSELPKQSKSMFVYLFSGVFSCHPT